jgi:hypothetical protein
MANENLSAAKKARQDEFYTQWVDIEREINAYREHDPDVFRGRTVLLPCDDPEWSNFTKFFALHFGDFGLKKLISTSYAPESNFHGLFYAPTLFETESPIYDRDKSKMNGRVFTLVRDDVSGDGVINIDDLQWSYLDGDGDFRSDEVTALRDEADLVITNPPFSLWREFVAWLIAGGKKFSIIGPQNAVTYKEVFPLIQENRVWLGRGFSGGDAYFTVPDSVEPDYAAGVFNEETRTVHFRNVGWFTNIDHGRRHEPLQLMTMADNIKFSKHKEIRNVGYQRYDNYDAIEVPFTDAIPVDYGGAMGVPVSFLNRYNPDQFELLGITDRGNEFGLKTKEYTSADMPNYGDLNRRAAIKLSDGSYKPTYARLLIRRRQG